MSSSRRSTVLALVLALLCASFGAVVQPPVAHAATVTYVVNTALDPIPPDGVCSPIGTGDGCTLRDAIVLANAAPDTDQVTIQFDIPQGLSVPGYNIEYPYGPSLPLETWTITLGSGAALPFITQPGLLLDGFSQEENTPGTQNPVNGPTVIIDGIALTSNSSGLTVNTSGVTIRGLGIVNFKSGSPGIGIDILSGNNNTIQGCYIGIDRTGAVKAPNRTGIRVLSATNTLIGGRNTQPAERNVISGNQEYGIRMEIGSDNKVQGNYIGLNFTGVFDVGNAFSGIYIYVSNGNRIGTLAGDTNTIRGNVISGNDENGILIQDGSNNVVTGNLIGTNTNGNAAISNSLDGVRVESSGGTAANNKIGDTTAQARNTISGNGTVGVRLTGFGTGNNQVQNNLIGLSTSGILLTGTYTQSGVLIQNRAFANTIGGGGANQSNVISGNKGDGVRINGVQTDKNVIAGNIIGLSESRLSNYPNTGNGITISANDPPELAGPKGNIIGGTGNAANTISANGGNGIAVVGALINDTGTVTITGNLIGLKKDFLSGQMIVLAGNGGDGVRVDSGYDTMIGGSTAAAGNTIVANTGNGIRLTDAVSTTIRSNQIGTLVSGPNVAAAPNQQNGILIDTVSISTTITSNEIRYNGQHGIAARDGSQVVTILDNKISRNGGKGIDLDVDPDNFYPSGSLGKSNHDIDPPFNLRVNQAGQLTGRVRVDSTNNATKASSCFECRVQVFGTDRNVLDGEGRDKIQDIQVAAGGYFTVTLSSIPQQLALTATDKDGNTSEFAVFSKIYGLNIYTAVGPTTQHAFPGQTITYTHRISNTGTVDFTDLQLSAFSKYNWPFTLAPANPISLAAGQSKPVTMTLTLPTGSDQRVRAGTIELTRLTIRSTALPTVTASLTDTTIVDGKFILQVEPASRNGITTQNTSIDYLHTLTNVGNLTGTLTLTASTDLGWKTTLTPLGVTLTPGQSIGATARVTLPQQVNAGTIAKTVIRITASDPTQNKIVTDTTTVSLQPLATMVPNQEGDAGAGETISFQHTVTNLSNGPATFKLEGLSSLGSKIKFRSNSPGIVLGSDNSFTVSNTAGSNFFNFFVDITVDPKAFRGDTDTVTLGLSTPDGTVIGGASVQDKINVTRSAMVPRLYMPLIAR